MPRAAKRTQSGAAAQSPGHIPGGAYGSDVERNRLAAVAPAPNLRETDPVLSQQPAPQQTGVSNQAPAQPGAPGQTWTGDPVADAAQLVLPNGGLLRGGTSRPGEPVTAGLPVGPGPGPEILARPMKSPTRVTLERMTAASGNPLWADLARRAGLT
jgi:hypothetical protein